MNITLPQFDFTGFLSQSLEIVISALFLGVIGSVCVLIIVSAITATQSKLK